MGRSAMRWLSHFSGVARACTYAHMIFTAVSKRDAVSQDAMFLLTKVMYSIADIFVSIYIISSKRGDPQCSIPLLFMRFHLMRQGAVRSKPYGWRAASYKQFFKSIESRFVANNSIRTSCESILMVFHNACCQGRKPFEIQSIVNAHVKIFILTR